MTDELYINPIVALEQISKDGHCGKIHCGYCPIERDCWGDQTNTQFLSDSADAEEEIERRKKLAQTLLSRYDPADIMNLILKDIEYDCR